MLILLFIYGIISFGKETNSTFTNLNFLYVQIGFNTKF